MVAVEAADDAIGQLLHALDDAHVRDQTLVIVTADHGGHGKVHSGSHQEVDREIPWIARGPGMRPGATIDQPIVTVDTAATVLSALKLPMPAHIAGVPVTD